MSLKVYTYPDECLETVSTPFDFNTDTIPNYENLEIFEQDMIKRFPVESIVLEIIEDIVKKIEYNS